jgi:acetyl esterase/lipase
MKHAGSMAAVAILVVLAWPLAAAPAATVQRDIPYVEGGGHKQQLDLYLPDAKGFATILFVHGGSLNMGDRQEAPFPAMGAAFQKAGLGFAAMSYRLFPDNAWPVPALDVAAAFAWVRKNIAARGGDNRRIFLVGHSSGARLVALVSSDPKYLRAFGLTRQDVAGCVSMGSITHDVEFEAALKTVTPDRVEKLFATDPDFKSYGSADVYLDAWPLPHVSAGMPPILIFVAEQEREHPPCLSTAEELVAAAHRCGARAAVEILPGRTHSSTIENMVHGDDPNLRRVVQFTNSPELSP